MKRKLNGLVLLCCAVALIAAGCGETSSFLPAAPSSAAPQTSAPPSTTVPPVVDGMDIGETAVSQTVEFTLLSAERDPEDASRYLVTFTLKNIGTQEHPYTYAQRLHLLDTEKSRIAASALTADGEDLTGLALAPGDSVTAQAVFFLPDDFRLCNFTYTYDIMGFGLFTYRLDGR